MDYCKAETEALVLALFQRRPPREVHARLGALQLKVGQERHAQKVAARKERTAPGFAAKKAKAKAKAAAAKKVSK